MQRKVAPALYLRRKGAIAALNETLLPGVRRLLVCGGHTALKVAEKPLKAAIAAAGCEPAGWTWYGGECTENNIYRLVREAQECRAEAIIGVGGGKALDTAKAAAWHAGLPVVTVPTIASTCAAFTGISILYSEEGVFQAISRQARIPEAVLVDLDIIASAPPVFLVAGMGDTLAKWYELAATARSRKEGVIQAALQLAAVVRRVLLEYGAEALEQARRQEAGPALGEVMDAVIMLSGLVSGLGGDECRTAAAHAVYSGLTCLPAVHSRYHGEIVAFGILVQLMLEGQEEEARALLPFYRRVGLPASLGELGVGAIGSAELKRVAEAAVAAEDMANMPFAVSPAMVVEAIRAADQLGRAPGPG